MAWTVFGFLHDSIYCFTTIIYNRFIFATYMKRYLITGGAGFIGSAIAKRLLEENHFVRILDNESRGSRKRFSKHSQNLEFVIADIRDFKSVLRACDGIDSIIHLAYINGTRFFYEKPDLVLSVGVKGMIHTLDAAAEKGVSELFLASSSEVYQTPPIIPTPESVPYFIPDPLNPRYSYAGGKIISELLSLYIGRTFLKRVVIFRPHNVYGPDMGTEHVIPELIIKVLQAKRQRGITRIPIQGTGEETRAFIYIDDFVDALTVLFEKGESQQIYNIGTNQEISVNNLLVILSNIMDKSIQPIPSLSPRGSVKRRCPDIRKITTLGFSPRISLEEGLSKTFVWYNTQH